MYWEFDIAYEAEPKYVINKNGDRSLSEGRFRYYLKDKDNNRISSYYDKIIYLGNNHFAVANYEPHIVTFNKYSGDKLIESRASANNIPQKWGVIKMCKYDIYRYDSWYENLVIPNFYDSILPNNDNTITVECNGKKTFVDIDENSENYSEQIYPCLFYEVDNFDIEHKGFVKVKFNGDVGYIPRNITNTNFDINLLTKHEAINLLKYFNGDISSLDFDTRYKYMCMTSETPALTRILKNKK